MSENEQDQIRKNCAVIQAPLELIPEPFAAYAEKLHCSQETILTMLADYGKRGIIRRIAGVLKHNKAGFTVNAMVAIAIPVEECDTLGKLLAQFHFISHCYRRTSYPDWPFTLYAMVHAKSTEEFSKYFEQIRTVIGENRLIVVLKSLKEYKKIAFHMEI